MSASASASFGSYFKVNGQITTEHSDVQKYSQSVSDIYIKTLGGNAWKMNYTFDEWVNSLSIKPAVVGLKLIYILDIIRDQYFPDISFEELIEIRNLFDNRVDVYLKNNYYLGCNDPTASNYVSYANVFDKSLCNYQYTFHFGGMYTVSSDPSFIENNIITETTSCPPGFQAEPLLTLTFNSSPHLNCPFPWWFRFCYNTYNTITTTTYVCISNQNQTTGMYFGGIYTNDIPNDITQDKSCPPKYIPYPIFHDVGRTVVTYICMAPYDIGKIVSIPFGGIFSYQYPNYMVGNTPVCGGGFERHPVGANPIAELTYCIGLGSLDSEQKDIIPPGYGNNLNEMMELYTIHTFENGSMIGINVNPLSSDTYFDQVVKISQKILEREDNNTSNNLLKGENDPCYYIREWMIKNKLYKVSNNLQTNNNNTILNVPKPMSDHKDNSLNIALGILIPTVVVLSIIIVIILIKKKGKRDQYYELNEK